MAIENKQKSSAFLPIEICAWVIAARVGTVADADLWNQTLLTSHYAGTLKSDPGGGIS